MIRWTLILLCCLPIVSYAETSNIKNIITVELGENTLRSNLLYVSPLRVDHCDKFHVIEHHQQTSINDSHISTIEVLAERCEPDYQIEYAFYLVSRNSNAKYCSYELSILSEASADVPTAVITGDCGYHVSSLKLSQPGEYHYTIVE